MLEFRNIVKKFKETLVINDISFSVKKGELVVLIGESGCGKTTTLKMINRLIDPTSGTILINGEDIAKKDVISLRRNMGYVIQQTGLFPHMSVKENIEIIPKVSKINAKKIKDKTLE
ncbi:MAG: ATP-binding cassette domain-containing protein, partial [Bacilli bacterium]|nr:ATP-binding cassette domain-containing protein [Bacilli bacterium]